MMSFKHCLTFMALLTTCMSAGRVNGQAPVTPHIKNVVLVHGAFADGSGWRAVLDTLTKHGYHVSIVQEPETSLAEDVAATKRIIDMQDGPVLLVGHSWGGQVVTEAGNDPKVAALVYINALVPDAGESVDKLESAMPPDRNHVVPAPGGYLMVDPKYFAQDFAADLPPQQASFMAASQVLIAASALKETVHTAAWRTKPSFAITSTADHIISPKLELWMYKRANAKITQVPGASHAIYVSHPEIVVKVIEAAANRQG